jgi:hypothetical protein
MKINIRHAQSALWPVRSFFSHSEISRLIPRCTHVMLTQRHVFHDALLVTTVTIFCADSLVHRHKISLSIERHAEAPNPNLLASKDTRNVLSQNPFLSTNCKATSATFQSAYASRSKATSQVINHKVASPIISATSQELAQSSRQPPWKVTQLPSLFLHLASLCSIYQTWERLRKKMFRILLNTNKCLRESSKDHKRSKLTPHRASLRTKRSFQSGVKQVGDEWVV